MAHIIFILVMLPLLRRAIIDASKEHEKKVEHFKNDKNNG